MQRIVQGTSGACCHYANMQMIPGVARTVKAAPAVGAIPLIGIDKKDIAIAAAAVIVLYILFK